jgi:hypothetical protein
MGQYQRPGGGGFWGWASLGDSCRPSVTPILTGGSTLSDHLAEPSRRIGNLWTVRGQRARSISPDPGLFNAGIEDVLLVFTVPRALQAGQFRHETWDDAGGRVGGKVSVVVSESGAGPRANGGSKETVGPLDGSPVGQEEAVSDG